MPLSLYAVWQCRSGFAIGLIRIVSSLLRILSIPIALLVPGAERWGLALHTDSVPLPQVLHPACVRAAGVETARSEKHQLKLYTVPAQTNQGLVHRNMKPPYRITMYTAIHGEILGYIDSELVKSTCVMYRTYLT